MTHDSNSERRGGFYHTEVADSRARPARLSDKVYGVIVERILQGEYDEGHRLPSEAKLAEMNQVSRPIVRQALSRLREDGLVRSQRGAGSYVMRRPDRAMLDFAPLDSLADMQRCFEFRAALEGESARAATQYASTSALKEIEKALQRLEMCIQVGELGVDADFGFHLAVANATNNRFFTDTLLSLKAQINFGQNLARNLGLRRPGQHLPEVQEEHVRIFEAIRAGDAELACQRMREHIGNSRLRVFEG
ncbi:MULTISPECIES: FadR/GntR family transcriptional regulator [unclassified Chromohalobacter]|uniref:FadR/GntR family transcriptional regulator n=1 Tax=unclassified Chromohalobacter TaxID=2628571 RepID=UPI0024687C35|nr:MULTISPECIES: FadR/GntR family transcriptional regulator [unclassified Chromohalobacter]